MRAMSSASWQCSIWARRQRSSAADGQSHHEEGLKRSRGGGAARRLGPTRAAGRRASVRPSGSGSGRPGRPSRFLSLAKEFYRPTGTTRRPPIPPLGVCVCVPWVVCFLSFFLSANPSLGLSVFFLSFTAGVAGRLWSEVAVASLKHRWDNKMRLPNTWLHRLTLTFPAFTLLYYGSLIARQPARSPPRPGGRPGGGRQRDGGKQKPEIAQRHRGQGSWDMHMAAPRRTPARE